MLEGRGEGGGAVRGRRKITKVKIRANCATIQKICTTNLEKS
jgi:hypothetical protein